MKPITADMAHVTSGDLPKAKATALSAMEIEWWRSELLSEYTSETIVDAYGEERADRYRTEVNALCDMARRYQWMCVHEGEANRIFREWLRSMADTDALDAAIDARIAE